MYVDWMGWHIEQASKQEDRFLLTPCGGFTKACPNKVCDSNIFIAAVALHSFSCDIYNIAYNDRHIPKIYTQWS